MQNADLHFSTGDLCVYEREFVCVRQRERVFQNQVEIEKVKRERERERAEEMIQNKLEKEKILQIEDKSGIHVWWRKKPKRKKRKEKPMDDRWCERKNNIKNKKS